MLRRRPAVLVLLAAAAAARAHFPFVVPAADGTTAEYFLSEELVPDEQVKAGPVGQTKLVQRDAAGRETPLTLKAGAMAYTVALPAADGPRTVYGTLDLGVAARGPKPYHLVYHPKTVVGDAFSAKPLGTAATPVEIVAEKADKGVVFAVLIDGRPAPAGTEVHVLEPDKSQDVHTTDAKGRTDAFADPGRYGAWAKQVLATPGKLGDKEYQEVRHYATLVIDTVAKADGGVVTPAPVAVNPSAGPTTRALARRGDLPATKPSDNVTRSATPLPEAVASFGAATLDGYLYVYGGHTADTHNYDTTAVSNKLHRLNLADKAARWEALPGGPGVQGMNLAAVDGKIVRVGGMEPRNAPGTDPDNFSLPQVSAFDPKRQTWTDLPPLPEGRSSHDVAVVGRTLYVVGGWTMDGKSGGNDWPETMLSLDLSADKPAWQAAPQPFQRRALMTAVVGDKVYAVGGMDLEDKISRRVDVYDTVAKTWSAGPELPGPQLNGFSPAAIGHAGKLYVSVGDGRLLRLDGGQWTKIAHTTPRIVHRLAVSDDTLWVIGGANRGKNFDLIETVPLPAETARH